MNERRFIPADISEIALVVTGGLLVVGAVVYARKAGAAVAPAPSTPAVPVQPAKTGITVKSADCRDWSIDSVDDYDATIRPVYESRVKTGLTDPWVITDAIIARAAPSCRSLSSGPRNTQEAGLQFLIFLDLVTHLEEDDYIDPGTAEDYRSEIYDWAIEHDVPEEWLDSLSEEE